VRTVLKLTRQDRLRAHMLGKSTVRIPVDAIHDWDNNTKL
jgi:hypothetical protein